MASKALDPQDELALLRAIDTAYEQKGYPPTFRELCTALRWSSTSRIRPFVLSLQEKQRITYTPIMARTLRVTPEGKAFLAQFGRDADMPVKPPDSNTFTAR